MHIYILRVTSMTNCTVERLSRGHRPGLLELFPFVIRAIEVCIFLNNIYVSDILVPITRMNSCIVRKKIEAMGPVL